MELNVNALCKSFSEKEVLKGVSFKAKSGKALGLLGRNGAGKTTIIRIIMGVFNANSGEVLLDNAPIDRNKIVIGYLPEERGMYPKKVIMEQLIYFGALRGVSKKDAVKTAEYWLDKLEMTEYKNKKLETLSKGNQQKIQLVATLIANPDIIILDEPFSGLDPVNAILLKNTVRELIENNKIVLFSSHQMNYIEEFCDDIAILNGGEIVLSGNIKEIKRSYDRRDISVISNDKDKIKSCISFKFDETDNGIIVHLNDGKEKSRLLAELSSSDADIDEIKVNEPTLNDIFVEYTEDKI